MKREYSKPMIMFENFTLSTNIAGDCEYKTNSPSASNCGIEYGSEILFLDSVTSVCTDKVGITDFGGDGEYNGYCYHVYSNGKNIFNS